MQRVYLLVDAWSRVTQAITPAVIGPVYQPQRRRKVGPYSQALAYPWSAKETPAYSSMMLPNVKDYKGRTWLLPLAAYLYNPWSTQQTKY
ncbi:hypothetical protein OsI_11557 [Oryza sativa Indica Group]|uniref:Uncharacterized protein n=1 Tax=Oryza sativa subsp. indica TaxID=39946 RepID=B8APF6_ORYSI|nr:hypothetical protein OsI_11557 [Oryza sativa Indica Group]